MNFQHPALIRLGEEVEEVKPPMASPTERRASKMALVPIGAALEMAALPWRGFSIVFSYWKLFSLPPRPQICMMNLPKDSHPK